MTQRLSTRCVIGLGLLVGAILYSEAAAQVTPPTRADSAQQQRDSVRAKQIADSIARVAADSITRGDTLRTPIPAYPVPPHTDAEFVWRGDAILASGAFSLTELVSRVPGAAGFRAGGAVSPSAPAYLGCFMCVRYFLDGLEIAAPDNRSGGILDNAEISLTELEEVRVVRGATELRVYLRTWGVVRTVPFTTIHIQTGADETSSFGGAFGKRTRSGGVIQVRALQFATRSRVNSGAGNKSSISARLGVIKPGWGIDAYAIRTSRSRDDQESAGGLASLPPFDGSRTDAYLRASWGFPQTGLWLQALAASMNVKEETPGTGPTPPVAGEPPADTSRTEAQYLFAGGTRLGGISVSGAVRLRSLDGNHTNELSLNAGTSLGGIDLSGYIRRDTRDSLFVAEVSARAQLLPLLTVSGSVGQTSPVANANRPAGLFANADVGLNVRRAMIHGGVLMRDSMLLAAPTVFDATLSPRFESEALGVYARITGPIWRAVHLDISSTHWDSDGFYRPEQLTRASVYIDTWLLHKLPDSTFHIYAGVTYDSRSETRFPTGAGGAVTAPSHTSISSHLEIRLLSAVIYWQNRNFRGLEISEVPGLRLPRRLSVYGVRWVLWN